MVSAGVEFPVSKQVDMDISAFYSQTNIHKDDIKHIKSYGVGVNIRFGLIEKEITYIH